MRKLLILTLFLVFKVSYSQQKTTHTISGYIRDGQTGESLISASVYDLKSKKGTVSNTYGFYSLTLEEDSAIVQFSYTGFHTQTFKMYVSKSVEINIDLMADNVLMEAEIVVENAAKLEESTRMSTIDIPIQQIKSIPALMGEVDVLKTMQLLPGVQSGNEGASGLYVRGGSPDQNLILLDDAPVYNASHLFGFFSVFNADAINSVSLIKGGFPARYGGRLSSVLDIHMKEGNMKKVEGEASIGLISSKLTVQGPIKVDTTSFIISARRTYVDVLTVPFMKRKQGRDYEDVFRYYFHDVNAKVNHKFSNKDRLFLSFYGGLDRFLGDSRQWESATSEVQTYRDKSHLDWGNLTGTMRWNHQFSDKLFMNTALIYSKYEYDMGSESTNYLDSVNNQPSNELFQYVSGIQDYGAKINLDYLPTAKHYMKTGGSVTRHAFNSGVLQFQNATSDTTLGDDPIIGWEWSGYVEDDWKINQRLKLNLGVHYNGFNVRNTNYHSFQPRISTRYLINENLSMKASYSEMQQYIHLLTNANVGLPTDLWVPATDNVLPQKSRQVALGMAKTFRWLNENMEISVEGYYKEMENLIAYKPGASYFNVPGENWEDKITSGEGWSYGGEFFLQRKSGDFTGWIGYTLSWTERQFDELNDGEKFPYKFDRRHDLSLVGMYKFNEKWDIAATWVYGTGNAITLPLGNYLQAGGVNPWGGESTIEYYGGRNSSRMEAYHRFDVGANLHKQKKKGEAVWNFSVYNAYNRRNPFYYYFDQPGQLKKVSLFPVLPSVSYRFKF